MCAQGFVRCGKVGPATAHILSDTSTPPGCERSAHTFSTGSLRVLFGSPWPLHALPGLPLDALPGPFTLSLGFPWTLSLGFPSETPCTLPAFVRDGDLPDVLVVVAAVDPHEVEGVHRLEVVEEAAVELLAVLLEVSWVGCLGCLDYLVEGERVCRVLEAYEHLVDDGVGCEVERSSHFLLPPFSGLPGFPLALRLVSLV